MKVIDITEKIRTAKPPKWSSERICSVCNSKCLVDQKDTTHIGYYYYMYIFPVNAYTWKCPVCETSNEFTSKTLDKAIKETEEYKRHIRYNVIQQRTESASS